MKYAVHGIPCLVLLNDKGEILSHSCDGPKYLGPGKVMGDMAKLASGGVAPAVAAAPAAASTAPPAGSPARSNTPDAKSPSGTNWDEVFKKEA
ncbi:MAG TPA: hypothetical protein VK993_10125 [Chthoniobacterales bacterium]|nr:hypothetical protein [Chthoniobacterales bacterium]